jgi:hypothetical protein
VVIQFTGIVTTGSQAGTLVLQWAQGTADATAIIVGKGSYLIAQEF